MTLLRRLVEMLLVVLPTDRSIVVHGWRDGEENSLRIAIALSNTVEPSTRLTLLCENPVGARRHLANTAGRAEWNPARVDCVAKNSARGAWRYLRATVVFSTHGMFGNPRPGRRRLHVLLGHGHGPKSASSPTHPFRHRSQIATTNNTVWGYAVIADQGIDANADAFATGNPRDDTFDVPVARTRLERLGLDPRRPLILWLPTYRVPRNAPKTSALREIIDDAELRARVETLRVEAERQAVTVVTKAHQLDEAAHAEAWGFEVVTSDSLSEAGLTFFQLLALADGLISDFSSVWVDYLLREKPTGLLFTDDEQYARGRGFNEPRIDEVASELILREDQDITRFVETVREYFSATERWPDAVSVSRRLGLVGEPGRTRRVLQVVRDRLRESGLHPLLGAGDPAPR